MLRVLSRKTTASRFSTRGLELLPLLCGSLPHVGPAVDLPASLLLLALQAKGQQQQRQRQQQQHVSLHPWQVLLVSAAAARQNLTSVPTLSGSRTIVTAATDSSSIAASPLNDLDKGPSTGTGATSGSSPAQPCPLHACLLRYGINDLAAFSTPKHLALTQETVSSNVEPKLAALAAEGLSPRQMAQLMGRKAHSLLWCSYKDTFLPNLQLLRQIAAYIDHRPHPNTPHVTAAGKVTMSSLADAAAYLSRDPSKVQQLLQWLEGSLGVGLEQLAACKGVCSALKLSAEATSAACLTLQEWQVPAQQVVHMLLRRPTAFSLRPELLSARLGALQQHLGLSAAAALQVVIVNPGLLTTKLESNLPPLLHFLDGYMGDEGAGRSLVRAQLAVGTVNDAVAEGSVRSLAARGYSQQDIRQMILKQPNLLMLNLDSPLQRRKLHWIEQVSPWTLDDFLSSPTYLSGATTRRLAARLALLRECGLPPPSTPGMLVATSDPRYMESVRMQLERQGRELPWASWADWEESWLDTEEGKEWGLLPLKD